MLATAVTDITLPTDAEGKGKIAVGTTAVEIAFTSEDTKYVVLSADRDNTGILYIGKSNVTNLGANALFPLISGERMLLPYKGSNSLWVVASALAQNCWIGCLY